MQGGTGLPPDSETINKVILNAKRMFPCIHSTEYKAADAS